MPSEYGAEAFHVENVVLSRTCGSSATAEYRFPMKLIQDCDKMTSKNKKKIESAFSLFLLAIMLFPTRHACFNSIDSIFGVLKSRFERGICGAVSVHIVCYFLIGCLPQRLQVCFGLQHMKYSFC